MFALATCVGLVACTSESRVASPAVAGPIAYAPVAVATKPIEADPPGETAVGLFERDGGAWGPYGDPRAPLSPLLAACRVSAPARGSITFTLRPAASVPTPGRASVTLVEADGASPRLVTCMTEALEGVDWGIDKLPPAVVYVSLR